MECEKRCGSIVESMKILWVGPFFSNKALMEKLAPNQASSRWSRGLLRGLEANGAEIQALDYCPERRWPAGNVFWQNNDEKWFLDWFRCERVSYLNVAGIKQLYLCFAYAKAAKRILRRWRPDVAMFYNTILPWNVSAMSVLSSAGVKCVPIILDGDDPRKDNWRWINRTTRKADGIVFLSYWMSRNFPDETMPILHMDGGADAFKGCLPQLSTSTNSIATLVYTGALDVWRGLEFMKQVVSLCQRQDVRFIFCGKYDKKKMWAEFNNDPRVDVRGFVSVEEIERICRDATVFLNVRDPNVRNNILNYPSKVPQYLAWGRPVVSTWIDSFSPDYRDVLEVCDNTPKNFVEKIDGVLLWTIERRQKKFYQIKSWFEDRKSWRRQARQLIDFCSRI